MSTVVLYVTTSGEEEAARIARALVEERLCACANVIPGVRSFYRWKGKVQDEREAVLVTKTAVAQVATATARIKQLHSYEMPCVVALPITGGNDDFLAWVAQEVGEPGR